MRWWILTDDWPPCSGGVAQWSWAVSRGLAAAGQEVEVRCRYRPDLAEPPGVRVVGVRGPSFARWGGMHIARNCLSSLRAGDQVLATTWPVATTLARFRRALGFDLHVVGHGSDLTKAPIRGGRRRTWNAASHRWVVSAYLKGLAQALGVDAAVLPAPIDASPAEVSDRRAWAYVGRCVPNKGFSRVTAICEAADRPLWVFGEGPLREKWQELAPHARFFGNLPNTSLREHLRQVQAVLLLPRPDEFGAAEGLGLCLIEGAAEGALPVGVRVGGVAEAAGGGVVLRDPEDALSSARVVLDALERGGGEQARAWVARHHGLPQTVARLLGATGSRP